MLYVIYDRLAEEAGPILECKNDAVAVRAYKKSMESIKAGLEDEYWLYCVGKYDAREMAIVPIMPRRIEINKAEVRDNE